MPTYLQLITSSLDVESDFSKWGKTRPIDEAQRLLSSVGEGTHASAVDIQRDPAYAYGVLLASGAAGAVGGTIGGKLVTAATAGGDANTADLIAAAINADATANKYVAAASRVATGTITIAAGAGVVAATVASLLAGQRSVTTSVTWATSDTATAAALAAAINALPNCPVVASSAAGVVTLWAITAGSGATNTGGNQITLAATGTGVTVSGALLTGGGTNANVLVKAIMPGTVGAGITFVASGTGITAPTGANLVGGQGAPGNSFTA